MSEQADLFPQIEVWRRVKNVRRWMNYTKQPCELMTWETQRVQITPEEFNPYTDERCFEFYGVAAYKNKRK
jgi:hypothetical protein